MTASAPRRIIVAITGATGTVFGIRALEALRDLGIESHLVLSKWGARTLLHETAYSVEQVKELATATYGLADLGACISSGSFKTDGMLIAPCSMHTLSAIAHGQGETLIHRAADVVLKERRKLVLVVRESPLNDIHLENMLRLSRMGVVIFPPVPAFYHRPQSLKDVVDQVVMRVMDQLGVDLELARRWAGFEGSEDASSREDS